MSTSADDVVSWLVSQVQPLDAAFLALLFGVVCFVWCWRAAKAGVK